MIRGLIRVSVAIAIVHLLGVFIDVPAQVRIARKPSASTSTGQFRSITIVTEPNSAIWVDGVLYGKTGSDGSLEIRTIAGGAHSIRVRSDGFKEHNQTISATQKGDLTISLVKTTDKAELAFQEAERMGSVDREKAVAAYKRAIALRPKYPEAFLALARTQVEMGDLEDALASVATARKLRPGYAEGSAVEARIHKEFGESEKGAAAFKRAITEGKGFQPEAYTGLGLIFKEKAEGFGGTGDLENETAAQEEATKNFKIALKQLAGAPDAMVIYQMLGLMYERMQKNSEAIAVYEEFLRIFPNSAEATAVRSYIVQLNKPQP